MIIINQSNRIINSNMDCIDIRSDTVTMPTPQMVEAIKNYSHHFPHQDHVLEELINKATKTFNMEAGILLPSGVMSNQISVMTWTKPGDEIILWDKCHIAEMENGSIGDLAGVIARGVESETGQLTVQKVQPYLRSQEDQEQPRISLICLQNSLGNGRVYSLENLRKIKSLAQKYKVGIHTDGARIFNASAALGVSVSELTKYTDSICFCLSKGLCAPYGSILLGKKQFIKKAKRNMAMLLGKEFNTGALFPAAGIIALEEMAPRVIEDNKTAKLLAQKLSEIRGIVLNVKQVEANIIFFSLSSGVKNHEKLPDFLKTKNIKFGGMKHDGTFRIITHYYIKEHHVEQIINHFKQFIQNNQ